MKWLFMSLFLISFWNLMKQSYIFYAKYNWFYFILLCPYHWHWRWPILDKIKFIVHSIWDANINKAERQNNIAMSSYVRITFTNHNHHIPHCLCVQFGSPITNLWSASDRYLVPVHKLAIHQEIHGQARCRNQAWFPHPVPKGPFWPQGVHSCTATGFHPNIEVLVLVGSMQAGWRVCCCADLTPAVAWEASAHVHVSCQCCFPSDPNGPVSLEGWYEKNIKTTD